MIELYSISIANILKNPNSSVVLFITILKAYIAHSYVKVAAATIKIIVNLLSFEKSLLISSARKPISPKAIPDTPIDFLATISKKRPNTIPKVTPNFFLKNNPINSTKIMYKFGIIPDILNHVKKLDCKK